MTANNIDVYMPVFIIMLTAVVIVGGAFFVSSLIAPYKPNKRKSTPYECGEQPIGTAWSAFNVRFYVVGLIFIIFDVESALMFPIVSVFKNLAMQGKGLVVLVEVLIFLFILVAGIAYCWRKGDLDWVKSYNVTKK